MRHCCRSGLGETAALTTVQNTEITRYRTVVLTSPCSFTNWFCPAVALGPRVTRSTANPQTTQDSWGVHGQWVKCVVRWNGVRWGALDFCILLDPPVMFTSSRIYFQTQLPLPKKGLWAGSKLASSEDSLWRYFKNLHGHLSTTGCLFSYFTSFT